MSIEHFDARTIDEALFILNKYGEEAKIIAGGTDLISLIKSRVITPKVLTNIKTKGASGFSREKMVVWRKEVEDLIGLEEYYKIEVETVEH